MQKKNTVLTFREAKQKGSKERKLIKYPQIVDIELQDKAIEISSANSREKETKNIYYAKGITKFVVNGEPKPTSTLKGNASYSWLNTTTDRRLNISINVIDSIAETEAKKLYKIWKSYENFVQPQVYDKQIEECENKISKLTSIFEEFDLKESRLNRAYTLGRMKDEEYDEMYDELMKEKQVFINEKTKLENQINKLKRQKENIDWKKEVVIETNTDEEIRDLVQMMIECIEVTKLGTYDYQINVIPNRTLFKIGIAMWTYKYNCSGGKIRLIATSVGKEYDVANIVKIRYESGNALKRKQNSVVRS